MLRMEDRTGSSDLFKFVPFLAKRINKEYFRTVGLQYKKIEQFSSSIVVFSKMIINKSEIYEKDESCCTF